MKDYDIDIKNESDFLKSCFKILGAVDFKTIRHEDLVIFIEGLSRHMNALITTIDRGPSEKSG